MIRFYFPPTNDYLSGEVCQVQDFRVECALKNKTSGHIEEKRLAWCLITLWRKYKRIVTVKLGHLLWPDVPDFLISIQHIENESEKPAWELNSQGRHLQRTIGLSHLRSSQSSAPTHWLLCVYNSPRSALVAYVTYRTHAVGTCYIYYLWHIGHVDGTTYVTYRTRMTHTHK